ncbi:sigma-70 family RNA polymerase sigma factor [Thalassospira sp. HF15]|uniref:RNA polymerase sigma factor n=1 Tax=Thalassospira sp. HF15 TaxID=2722755 RepID=UPI001431B8A0|nr:sigma-70 family RNA polymerase sigma factor [Thalassospira sp. HF15]
MQNEKNSPQDEATLTEAEISFAKTLEQSLTLALGDDDKVTSIWSRLKPEQRARIAEDYLAKLAKSENPDKLSTDTNWSGVSIDTALDAHAISQPTEPVIDAEQTSSPVTNQPDNSARPPHTGQQQYSPPPGYPADFNPLAGFPGLEPSRTGPSPEDIIAGALGTPGANPTDPLDILRGLVPGADSPALRQPVKQAPVTPTAPSAPQENPDTAEQPIPQGHPQQEADLGPAAPNFWPLWIDQQDTLLKQCLKLMSGNMDDAQDALSEAMVKASTKFEDSMDEIRNHRAWLSRIVHNACIDLHRQNRRKAEYREETHGAADTPASPMTAPITPSPEESYLAGEKLDQLETALLAMQEKLRKPLLMRCVQDRTYDEIASALGLSNCAVRKRVQLAREHLRASGIQ